MAHRSGSRTPSDRNRTAELPLVVVLNCLEDLSLEQEALAGAAVVEHVGLGRLSDGRIESAAAVLVHSFAFLPRAAQRLLRPWQLVLCLGSADRAVDSALAADLGLRLIHVDAGRAEEVADTVMALFLGLLRRTHLLSRHASAASSSSAGWLGSVQPLCRGMRRCRGLVVGIVGRSASARCVATRSLAFRMSVLYFDLHEGKKKSRKHPITFPSAARRMDTLNDLLAASDLVTLHCSLSDETVHLLNAESLQNIKPGAFIVATGSSQLIDDCALKQLLIDGTIAGFALDGAEGPQWMEAWVREMPNVLILPRSADYSEEVWMEIREKAVSVLQSFFLDGVIPKSAISDEDEDISEIEYGDDQSEKQVKESPVQSCDNKQLTDESQLIPEYYKKQGESNIQSEVSGLSQNIGSRTSGKRSRSRKKGKKRPDRQRCQLKLDDLSEIESTSHQDEDTAMSGREQMLSSSSRFASPENVRSKQMCLYESNLESTLEKQVEVSMGLSRKSGELLKDGFVIALHARDRPGLHVSRQRVPGGGWFLDTMCNVTKRDPAAQFLVSFRSKDTLGLRSFAAGGKLLQINRRMEFVFASHSFDVWESWMLEGSLLEECKLVNCRNPLAVLDVRIEILAAVGEDDGVARWLD
ncbi:C-terminal binding protein AN-like [Phoenix dactylifera]|uniref:C-terminal binding protein AN-like n=1 Tax=Phoenix dactylifera TaxID=42345 RepID=A0A8B8ZJ52_PHODC|nr:C-terminal binding protein AN-like [Phoenix dactylifera]